MNLKSLLFDEPEAKPETSTTSSTKPTLVNTTPVPSFPVTGTGFVGAVTPVSPDDQVYSQLAAQTNWEISPVFASLKKFLDPMASLQVDPKTKFQIALAQAVAQDGINASDILNVFDSVKNGLETAKANFSKAITSHYDTEVTAVKKQAEDLQVQVKQLTEQAFTAEQKLQSAQHQFDLAYQTRSEEISREQAKYRSMLG